MALPSFNHQLEALQRRQRILDEEFLGRVPKRRKRRLDKTERDVGGVTQTSLTDINWFAPSFLVEWSRGLPNVRIPFVGLTSITKSDVPRSADGRTHPRFPEQGKAAEDHFGYIERQDRAARDKGERHLDYIERDEARDRDPEAGYVGHVLSNIHRNPQVRRDFARRVWAAERSPHVPRLLAWSTDANWWAEAAAKPDAPDWVRRAAELVSAAVSEAKNRQKKSKALKPFQVDLGKTDPEEGYGRLVWSDQQTQPGELPKLDFSSRYGGRVQHRLVMELPFGLTGPERFEIARAVARWLKKQRFMYVIAIHQPDSHNDSRNFHLHVDFYDRNCRWLKRFGLWDFEVTRKASNGDTRYPYRQKKPADFTRDPSGKGKWWEYRAKILRETRHALVEASNSVLEASGLSTRYHVGPAKELGLEITPMVKLGGKRMAAERAGVETKEGTYNAEAVWGDRTKAIEAHHAKSVAQDNKMLAKLRSDLFATGRAHNVNGLALLTQIEELTNARATLQEHRLQLDMVNFEFEKARSRAEAVLREAGKAQEREATERSFKNSEFRARRAVIVADAQRHLDYLETIAPTEAELIDAQNAIAKMEREAMLLREGLSQRTLQLQLEKKSKEIRIPLAAIREESAGEELQGFDKRDIELRVGAYLADNPGCVRVDDASLVIAAPQAILTLLAKHHHKTYAQKLLLPFAERTVTKHPSIAVPDAREAELPLPESPAEPTKQPRSQADAIEHTGKHRGKQSGARPPLVGVQKQAQELADRVAAGETGVTNVPPSNRGHSVNADTNVGNEAQQSERASDRSTIDPQQRDKAAGIESKVAAETPGKTEAEPHASGGDDPHRENGILKQAQEAAAVRKNQRGPAPNLPSHGPRDSHPDPRVQQRHRDKGKGR